MALNLPRHLHICLANLLWMTPQTKNKYSAINQIPLQNSLDTTIHTYISNASLLQLNQTLNQTPSHLLSKYLMYETSNKIITQISNTFPSHAHIKLPTALTQSDTFQLSFILVMALFQLSFILVMALNTTEIH